MQTPVPSIICVHVIPFDNIYIYIYQRPLDACNRLLVMCVRGSMYNSIYYIAWKQNLSEILLNDVHVDACETMYK